MRNCDNCYWKTESTKFCSWDKERPAENTCDRHNFNCIKCDCEIATHKINGNAICMDCLLEEIGVEKIEVSKHQYFYNGDYLGDSEEHEIDEIINKMKNYNLKFETLEED